MGPFQGEMRPVKDRHERDFSMNKSFLKYDRPWLTGIVSPDADTPEKVISEIEYGIFEGADSFCIEITRMREEFWNKEDISRVISACGDRPVYTCAYRSGFGEGHTDEELEKLTLLSAESGADLLDVMGDLYHPEPYELTEDEEALKKQRALIEKLHAMGKEVLISSHNHAFYPREKTLEWALSQERRGADVVKIIGVSDTEEELVENLKAYALLNKNLKKPYLFMTGGAWCQLTRECTGRLGAFMYLGRLGDTGVQPAIRSLKFMTEEMCL